MFALTLVVGVATVMAIALSPLYARAIGFPASTRLGAVLVTVAIGIGVCSVPLSAHAWPADYGFLVLFVAFFVGALLILADDPPGRDDDANDAPDGDPPWWPEFEAGFGDYSKQRRTPIASR